MTLIKEYNIYNKYDYDLSLPQNNNKLLCTFTNEEGIESLLRDITNIYDILYNKIFILQIKGSDEFVITYNIEQGNIGSIPENTILVHRKKEFNVLYSINSLNELIKSLNNGILDNKYPVNWQNYKNSILLTQEGVLKQLNTKIYQIINL